MYLYLAENPGFAHPFTPNNSLLQTHYSERSVSRLINRVMTLHIIISQKFLINFHCCIEIVSTDVTESLQRDRFVLACSRP